MATDFELSPEEVSILLGLVKDEAAKYDKNTREGQLSLVPLQPLKAKLEELARTMQIFKSAKEWDELVG